MFAKWGGLIMINRVGGIPIYLQIAYHIQDEIVNGTYGENVRIPAEKELASTFGVSRMTARNAVTYLVDKGLVYRMHGKGAFVSTQKMERNLNKLLNFQQDMEALGMTASSRLLNFIRRLPTQREQQLLNIHKNQEVFNVRRIRYADNEPLGIQNCIVPVHFIPHLTEINLDKHSLYRSLEDAGHELEFAEQRIETVLAPEIAKIIDVPIGDPFFYYERVSYTKNDIPIELLHSYFYGEKYSFHITLYSE